MRYSARENEPSHNCRRRLGLVLLNLVLPGAVSMSAQLIPNLTPPPAPAATTTTTTVTAPQGPQAIPASDIPERLRQAANIVRGADGRAAPLAEVKTIESQLPELTKGIADLAKWSRSRVGSEEGKPESLSGLRLVWDVNRQRLDAWQALLKERSSALQQDNAALQTESAAWSVTSDVAYDQQIPDEIIAQITQTIQDVTESQEAVLARRNEVLKLQNRVSALRIEIDKVTDELTAEARPAAWRSVPPGWPAHLEGDSHE